MITTIFATNRADAFGNFDGSLPWPRSNYDMKHFMEVTKRIGTVVMGRNTYESLLTETKCMKATNKYFVEPLEGRRAIILTSTLPDGQELTYGELYNHKDSLYFFNRDTVTACRILERKFGDICIIGGSGVIRDTVNITDQIYRTVLENDLEGDIVLDIDIPHELDYFTVFPDKSGVVTCFSKEETCNEY